MAEQIALFDTREEVVWPEWMTCRDCGRSDFLDQWECGGVDVALEDDDEDEETDVVNVFCRNCNNIQAAEIEDHLKELF